MKAKPFLVIVCCLFVLLLFAGGMVAENDLTPDDPPAPRINTDDISPLSVPAGNPSASGSGCYSPYLVGSGDTLSKIARACGVSLKDIVAANSGLSNPNLLHPNQELRIPFAAQPGVLDTGWPGAVVSPVETSVSPTQTTMPAQTPLPAQAPTVNQAQAPTVNQAPAIAATAAIAGGTAATAGGEIPGKRVGETYSIEIKGLPAQANVLLFYGTSGGTPITLPGATSDAAGNLMVVITIPPDARPGEMWIVTATSSTSPAQTATSEPFQIGGSPR